MPAAGVKHDEAARARIARGTRWGIEKRRRIARIAPGELLELQRTGTLAPSLKPYAAQAVDEALGFVQALGGDEQISEQRIALIQDTSRAGLILRALVAHIGQSGTIDTEEVSKVVALINARRQTLGALGLDRVQRDVDSLPDYLARKARETDVHDGIPVPSSNAPREDGCS